jgi:Tol biopolymer transport system component
MQTLTYVNLKDNAVKTVTSSSQIKAIDWVGTRLVYVMLDDNAANDSAMRYKLMSYDYVSGDNRQLAQTNYFNSVVPMGGRIFYAPASAYQNGINVGVFAVHADGSGKEVILDKEAWNMFRTDHDTITIAVEQEWYNFKQGANKAEKLAGQPNDTTSRMYVDSPDGKHSIWVDNRDGKGTLMLYDAAKKTESVLLSESGITGPIRWLTNTAFIYRTANSGESADYVLPITGGSSHKISDVTNASGIDRWSY